ncbi:aspartyl-tRNA synthetase [Propionibacterium sp. oral taxon 192 str. F0372]|uniref:aspartate--tRNA ligase n=1 Tax=Propionibacterium sp. oral taxon 192 TaxID=671222 RepID=UPI000352E12B|nr:aspartate--tRNA ligase [Propionibacterium sp. oral taxon 192]EPH02752.1 aspartyl-tRNA synthetase [Propionibacterium sp. oral taxon 192 str. F0372]
MIRNHLAGALDSSTIGTEVELAGWVDARRDHGGVVFIDLRDRAGVVQCVIREELVDDLGAHKLRNEFCLAVRGKVEARSADTVNPNMATGEVEVAVTEIEVLNPSAPLPFPIDERVNVGEDARLKYRYLDLRRPRQAQAMRLRSRITHTIRRVLDEYDFVDIETPTLTRSTPEGARDFLVPARLHPGSWYALPQSPQLFKQLLMVAGMERYYQIARCYRDEDFRADRQPEFTQLDIEMSFVDQNDVIALSEAVMREVWRIIDVELPDPMPRITWHEAMDKYGSDKPDLRFGNELHDLTEFFANTPFRVFQADYVGCVVMPGGASQPRRQFDAWQEWAKQRGARGLAYITVGEDGILGGPVAKNISDEEKAGIATAAGAEKGDAIFFAAGEQRSAQELLGAARLEIARRCEMIPADAWAFCWVMDAPMFKSAAAATADGDVALGHSRWTAVHHAFTSPKPESMDTFDTDPGSALSYGYDFVCNGVEVGGGSIRIHRRDVQERVFGVMGLSEQEAQEKFGFLLEAFAFGAPPHGGVAFGLDRLVSLIGGFETIRDVIAFPKSGGGFDPLTEAPAPITAQQRKEAGVDATSDKSSDAQNAAESTKA